MTDEIAVMLLDAPVTISWNLSLGAGLCTTEIASPGTARQARGGPGVAMMPQMAVTAMAAVPRLLSGA